MKTIKKILLTSFYLLLTIFLFAQQQTINNGETGLVVRNKMNTMFGELYDNSVNMQFSADGSTSWHETYSATDNYFRISRDVGGTWGDAIPITSSLLIQFSADAVIWSYSYTAGDDYYRFSTDGGTVWTDEIFISAGDQTITLTGDVTGTGTGSFATTIANDKILESMLKSVNTPTDEYALTYESTTGDFEWQVMGGSVTGTGTDNVIPRWDGTTDLEDGGIVDNSDATAMTITSSEMIGLGDKTSPSYVLDVEDSYSLGYVSRFVNTSITGNGIYVKGGANAGDYPLYVANTDNDVLLRVDGDGEIRMGEYGVGTFTGTVAKYLAVDASGYLIETSGSGDDWGAQVVVSDATLSGTGITGDPLSAVSSGLWTSGTNGIELTTIADNVGIGVVSDADYKLYVYDNAAAKYAALIWNGSSTGEGLIVGANNTSDSYDAFTVSNSTTHVLNLTTSGKLQLGSYGSGSITGTATKFLAVDASGNIIEEDGSGGGATDIDGLSDAIADATSVFLGSGSGVVDDGTSNGNVGVGINSLNDNTSGLVNVSIGNGTLALNITGEANVAIGYQSIPEKTASDDNIAIGLWAQGNSSGGNNNVSIGTQTLNNSSGNNNVALGYFAGYSNTVSSPDQTTANNTLIGYQSFKTIQTGANNNIGIGYGSGDNVTTGANNIIIGYNIDAQSATGSNTMSIGNLIFGTGLTSTGTTVSSGDIGIGVASPDTKLDVNGATTGRELSSDPSDPDEGSYVTWMSDGTGAGDDGDIMMKITAGGSTKTTTLVDFSAL